MNAIRRPESMLSITDYAPGIHLGVPSEVYHRRELGVVNKGALDQVDKTPAHYRAWVADQTERVDTPALLFGKALHSLVLEPDLFFREWAQQPDFGDLRTKIGKERRDAWSAEHQGVTTVSVDDWQRLHAMRKEVMAHPIAGPLLTGGEPEATIIYTDPRTGLICKVRVDYLRRDLNIMADLKSTEDASPRAFARSVVNYRYHVQDAHYTAAGPALGLGDFKFVFIAVEKSPPYSVGVYMLDNDARDRGYELRDRGMDSINDCLKADEWPGLPPVVNTLSIPAYAFTD